MAFAAAIPALIGLAGSIGGGLLAGRKQGALTDAQKREIYSKMDQAAPDKAAYDTSKLEGYEDYFSKAGDATDPRMAEVLNLAGKRARGEGPSVAQAQSDAAIANLSAEMRRMANAGGGGGMATARAMKAGSRAAAEAAGQAAIARAAEQTGALHEFGMLSAQDVEQRRAAKEMAAKIQTQAMASRQAYSAAYSQYMTDYANTMKSIFDSMNGNSPAAMQSEKIGMSMLSSGIGALGQAALTKPAAPAGGTQSNAPSFFAALPSEASLPIG